jgi:regulatory protein
VTDSARLADGPVEGPSHDGRLQQGLELAYRYLNARDRTTYELRRHLEDRGIDAEAAASTISALVDQGYLDDARFARLLVEDKRRLEAWGTDRIRQVLLTRGIDRDLVDVILGDQATWGDPDRARELLRRRFPSPPQSPRDRDRAFRMLLRKGYDSETASDALAAYVRLP